MAKRLVSIVTLPLGIAIALLFGLVGGARAMEDGTCTYNVPSGTCTADNCGGTTDPHECIVHEVPSAHCDCVPKGL